MRKLFFCICENKDADQLRSNCTADQRLCFRYTDSTIPLLPKSESSSRKLPFVIVQPVLCWTWSETPKTGFLKTRIISCTTADAIVEMERDVPRHEKPCFLHKRKQGIYRAADQHLYGRYTLSTTVYFLNPKFQVFSHRLWLYSPVCVGPGR